MFCRKFLKYSPFLILTAMNLCTLSARADGGTSGGGGDAATEMRMDSIRADILKWIGEGGARSLKLPARLTYEAYADGMERFLQSHAVVIGSVTPEEEAKAKAAGDEELQVSVNGQPKTCRGFVSAKDGLPHILCAVKRFGDTPPADQYRLLHHEYAGIAGVELNQGASSDYEVSSQITDYLVSETVLRLSVTKRTPTKLRPETIIEDGMIIDLTLSEDIWPSELYEVSKDDCRLFLTGKTNSRNRGDIKAHTVRTLVRGTYTQHWQSSAPWPFSLFGNDSLRVTRLEVLDDPQIMALECRTHEAGPSAGEFDQRIQAIGLTIGVSPRPKTCLRSGGWPGGFTIYLLHPFMDWREPRKEILATDKDGDLRAVTKALIKQGKCTTIDEEVGSKGIPAL